jgi:hypothetical protein
MLIVQRIAAVWTIALVPRPSCPAKAKPVLAAFACTVAPVTKVVRAFITLGAMVVELVLEMFLAAVFAHNLRLGVQCWCSE